MFVFGESYKPHKMGQTKQAKNEEDQAVKVGRLKTGGKFLF